MKEIFEQKSIFASKFFMFSILNCYFILQIEKTVEATSHALVEMHRQWDSEMVKLASGENDMSIVSASCASIKNSSEDLELYYVTVWGRACTA